MESAWSRGDPSTYGEASGSWQGSDANGDPIEITWWLGLHLRKARHIQVTVIRVLRHRATDRPRDPRESWLLWEGESDACVPAVALGYRRRYSHKHGYREDSQALLWAQTRVQRFTVVDNSDFSPNSLTVTLDSPYPS